LLNSSVGIVRETYRFRIGFPVTGAVLALKRVQRRLLDSTAPEITPISQAITVVERIHA
jgi:hypothetical protein